MLCTDEVVQIFVCCATFVLSVGPFFFFSTRSWFFLRGACVGARARAGVGTWVRACRGVGVGVTMFSRANRVCRATNHAHTPADANVDG